MDTGNLCAQVILLLLEVEWVCDDVALKVAGEADLDGASGSQVLRVQIGQSNPRTLSLVSNIVSVLVDTDATGLTTLRSRVLRQVLWLEGLNDVVVLDGTVDLTPEAE